MEEEKGTKHMMVYGTSPTFPDAMSPYTMPIYHTLYMYIISPFSRIYPLL